MKDIAGSIVIRLVLKNSGEDIQDLTEMRTAVKTKDADCYFDYVIDFYVSSDKMPKYSVVKIETASEFTEYINSLKNNYIPNNTVVIIDSGDTLRINSINSFSIPHTSMVVGAGENGVVIEYTGSVLKNEIITYNYGVISGITFNNFKLSNSNANKGKFSLILNNYGTIYKVNLNNIYVNGGDARYVAGLVSSNWADAVINNCSIDGYTLISVEYVNYICTNCTGVVYSTSVQNGATVSGSFYPYGKNGDDND